MTDRATAPLRQPARADAPLDPAAPSSALAATRPAQLATDDGLMVPQGGPAAATPSGEDEAVRAAPAPAPAPAADPSPATASGHIAPFGNIAPPAPPPDLQQRLDEAAKIADPHLRQAVEANIRLLTQRERMAFTDQQRAAKAQAKAIIDQGGDLGMIPGKVLLQIDENGRQALHDYAAAHGNPRTDAVTYYALKNQALDDPAAFQGVDLGDHMARLDAKDYGELTQLQTRLRNGQPPADLPLQQVYKANTDRMLQQLGLPSGPTISAPANDAAPIDAGDSRGAAELQALRVATRLRQEADQQTAATEIASGRKLTPSEHRSLLEDILARRTSRRDPNAPDQPGTAAASIANQATMGAAPAGSATEISDAAKAFWQSYAAPTLRAGAGLAGEIGVGTALGAATGFVAGMWPKSTASPELDELQGAQINESSKKRFRQQREKQKEKSSTGAKGSSGNPTPPPDPQDQKPPVFKRPNDPLQTGDHIDLSRFTKRIKLDGDDMPYMEDEDSGYRIQPDKATHGGREWKLVDRWGKRIKSLSEDGKVLSK